MKNKLSIILMIICAVLAVTVVALSVALLKGRDPQAGGDQSVPPKDGETEHDPFEDIDILEERPFGEYTPLLSDHSGIQFGKDYIYFVGKMSGIYKYDIQTGEVSSYCTDPLCKHRGSSTPCKMKACMFGNFFRAYSDVLVYSAGVINEDTKIMENNMYSYDPKTMETKLIMRNAPSISISTISNKYAYFLNSGKTDDGSVYYNCVQINLKTGEEKVFGEKSIGVSGITVRGALNGKLFLKNNIDGKTYVCDEEDLDNTKLFWEHRIYRIWMGTEDMFFISIEGEGDETKYFLCQTDFDGNLISRHELPHKVRFESFYDGRYYYYIPDGFHMEKAPDGSDLQLISRELYRLDVATGECTLVLTFNGDYKLGSCDYAMNRIMVKDNKLYIGKFTIDEYSLDDNGKLKWEHVTDPNACICIIDMETGDMTTVSAGQTSAVKTDTVEINTYDLEFEK